MIIEPSLTAFTGFPFALMFLHVRSRIALFNITKYMSSTGIIMYFKRPGCSLFSPERHTRESSLKGTDCALANVFYRGRRMRLYVI